VIKIISFDVDGTLIDQEYNDLIWLGEVPRLYSEAYGLDYDEAYEYVKGEFDRVGEYDLRWYDLNYWLRTFSLPFSSDEILEKFSNRLRVYPETERAFELLAEYEFVITTSMPRDFLKVKMKKLNGSFSNVFSTVSDFKSVKTAEIYSKICRELECEEKEVLHVGDLWDVDYIAPKAAGLNALCIDRTGGREGEGVIKSLEEIPSALDCFKKKRP
jgi:HAD superfamily hydrolase (TIGR01549 family)